MSLLTKVKPYYPSIFAFLLAIINWQFPQISAFFISGAFLTFAIVYAKIVSNTKKVHANIHRVYQNDDNIIEAEIVDEQEPDFKNVTIKMFKSFNRNS